jgi:hypothetical protein
LTEGGVIEIKGISGQIVGRESEIGRDFERAQAVERGIEGER